MREVVYNLLEMTEPGVRSQGNMSHVARVPSIQHIGSFHFCVMHCRDSPSAIACQLEWRN